MMIRHDFPRAADPLSVRTGRQAELLHQSPALMAWLAALLALAALVTLGGCASGSSRPSPAERPDSAALASMHGSGVMEYRIGPADVLSIGVWNHPELNQTVTVRPDGQISFSLVGDIAAVGLTPLQLQAAMEQALGKYIDVIPGEVSVVVDEVHSYTVSVLGEVRLPGRFAFQNQASVLDALAEAGGLTEFASSSNIVILRTTGGETEKIRFDYPKLLRSETGEARVLVFPGDIIVVP